MTLAEFFPRAYFVGLRRREDRFLECLRELAKNKMQAHWFEAFDIPNDPHKGCTKSHRELIRKIAYGPHERTLICEDDFCAITKQHLKDAGFQPSQDVWKTHCSILNGDGTLPERFEAMIPFIPPKWDVLYVAGAYGENPITRVNKHVLRCGLMQTTSTYGITRDFARTFTEIMDAQHPGESHPGPIDNVFGIMAPSHLFYVLQPRLAFQRAIRSDITGLTNSYLFSMTDNFHEGLV